tara:strand:+ start:720 stop:1034 length:315 start_codon:yes stop_codon:yes gene_type:complete
MSYPICGKIGTAFALGTSPLRSGVLGNTFSGYTMAWFRIIFLTLPNSLNKGPRRSGPARPLMFVQFLGNTSRNLWNTLEIDLDSVQPYGTIPISDNQHPKGKTE